MSVISFKELEDWKRDGYKEISKDLYVKRSFLMKKFSVRARCPSCGDFAETETVIRIDSPKAELECVTCRTKWAISLRSMLETVVKKEVI